MGKQATKDQKAAFADFANTLYGMFAQGARGAQEVLDMLKRAIDDPNFGRPGSEAMFTPPMEQVVNLLLWNQEYALGFDPEEVALMLKKAPLARSAHHVVTLCWALTTLQSSIAVKFEILRGLHRVIEIEPERFETYGSSIKLVKGAPAFVPSQIWWEIVDVRAYRNHAPSDVPSSVAAGMQAFDVAIQHPNYIRAQNGGTTPYQLHVALAIKRAPHRASYFGGNF